MNKPSIKQKTTTGLKGLDNIMNGGYPLASSTLLKGGPGTGKTVFSLCFANAQLQQGQSVISVTCEESPDRLYGYMESFGMPVQEKVDAGQFSILDFRPHLNEQIVGEFDLSPILFRISHAIEKSGAKVLIIDSLQNLLLSLGMEEPGKEFQELLAWVRDQQITTLITVSKQQQNSRRDILEEYAVDCVIHLDQKVDNNLMTRYLRVVKMRGSGHGTNTYPFSLTKHGVSILPITGTRFQTQSQSIRYSSGVERLDEMLGGQGYQAGSTIMFSGRAGCGKTILAATIADTIMRENKKVLFISFEESEQDLLSNLRSVNIDLAQHQKQNQLVIHAARAVEMGLEDHLISIIDFIDTESPDLLVLDPISALVDMGSKEQVKMLLIRFISYIKSLGITLIVSELLSDFSDNYSELAISSLMDTWIRMRQIEGNGELNRLINVVKSRGSKTSNQIKEFTITDNGIQIEDPYIGEGELVIGSAKQDKVARDMELVSQKRYELDQIQQIASALEESYQSKQKILDAEFETERKKLNQQINELKRQAEQVENRRQSMQVQRG